MNKQYKEPTMIDYEEVLETTGRVRINNVQIITTPSSYKVIQQGQVRYTLPLNWYTPKDVIFMTLTNYPVHEGVAY